MKISPPTLQGQHVRLEPLTRAHEAALNEATRDGELWNLTVTTVPTVETMAAYIDAALLGQTRGSELPFAIVNAAANKVVGSTRFYDIKPEHRGVTIGYTWLSASAQRSAINTEAKLLLLTHAFEQWDCIRVELVTDVLNERSRNAILKLGASQEGILRNHMIMPNGRIRDSVFFSIIQAEWPEVKARLQQKLAQRP